MAREVGDGEQEIADLFLDVRRRSLGPCLRQLRQFLGHLGLDAASVRPVETHCCGALAETIRPEQRRQAFGDRPEQARRAARGPLLLGLDLLPLLFDLACVGGSACTGLLPEDVRVAPHQLVAYRAKRVGDVEVAALGADLGQKYRLQQEIPKLVAQRVGVAAIDGVDHLVGLLDDERA